MGKRSFSLIAWPPSPTILFRSKPIVANRISANKIRVLYQFSLYIEAFSL